jgi:hypothetical protein
MHISRVISGFFLLFQLVLLIDFAYTWNESWTSENRPWQKAVLVLSVLMYLAALTFFILDLHFFATESDCKLEKFFIAMTFCLTFIMSALSISPLIAEGTGGLLPAGVLTLYSYYLLFSALTSDPSSCNTVSNRSSELAPLIIGLVLTASSVTYASWSVASNDALFSGGEQEKLNIDSSAGGSGAADAPEHVDMEKGSKSVSSKEDDDDEEYEEPTDSATSQEKAKLSARFHALMAMASMYICMLLSAWGSQSTAEGNTQTDLADANMWIKMCTRQYAAGRRETRGSELQRRVVNGQMSFVPSCSHSRSFVRDLARSLSFLSFRMDLHRPLHVDAARTARLRESRLRKLNANAHIQPATLRRAVAQQPLATACISTLCIQIARIF